MVWYLIWSIIIGVITFIIYRANSKRYYFKKWGIPQPKELPFLGVYGCNDFSKKHISLMLKGICDMNKEAKYFGFHMFMNKTIIVRDPELIKSVLVKNFDHFAYRKEFIDENSDPLFGKSLAMLNGDKWREIRNLLTPAFTTSKMRTMFVLMSQCAENFSKQLIELYGAKDAIDMKDVFTKYSNDVIATCAFGLEIDSLKNPDNEFYVRGKTSTNFRSIPIAKQIFITMFPELSRKLGLRFITKDDTNYFLNVIKTTINTRLKRNIKRPDMLQILMEARGARSDAELLEITAQAFIFFLAGFDTTSSQMSCIAHELAVNQNIQRKLQEEVDSVMNNCNDQPTYEAVNNMRYMDAVFNESLRLYPNGFLNRVCSKEFVFPPAVPGAKPYTVKVGDDILVPPYAVHVDPDNHEDPEKFDPDRYLDKKIVSGDANNLGFGLGPRMCIGNRFAILETKVLFLYLLSRCNLLLCDKSPVPFEYDVYNFFPAPTKGFWLKVKPGL